MKSVGICCAAVVGFAIGLAPGGSLSVAQVVGEEAEMERL